MRSRGLTLVEMIATLAIVGMVTAASLALTANLLGRQKAAGGIAAADATVEKIRHVLSLDMAHATRCRVVEGGLKLRTRTAVRPGTMEIAHLPVEVLYEIGAAGNESWLVRSQCAAGDEVFRELVCRDVTDLSFVRAGGGEGGRRAADNLNLAPGDAVSFDLRFYRNGTERTVTITAAVQ